MTKNTGKIWKVKCVKEKPIKNKKAKQFYFFRQISVYQSLKIDPFIIKSYIIIAIIIRKLIYKYTHDIKKKT